MTNSPGSSPWDFGPVGPTRGVVCHSGVVVFTDLIASPLLDPSYVFLHSELSLLSSFDSFPQIETSEYLFFVKIVLNSDSCAASPQSVIGGRNMGGMQRPFYQKRCSKLLQINR